MIVEATVTDILYVCHNMRERDLRQLPVFGFDRNMTDKDMDRFAVLRWSSTPFRYALINEEENRPITVGGYCLRHGVATGWLVSTDEIDTMARKYKRELFQIGKRAITAILNTRAAHRMQAEVVEGFEGWETNCRYLEAIGMKKECVRHKAGAHGENLIAYSATLD